jgi:essential nuclear protein 1
VLDPMAKKRSRHQNPQPFLADDNASLASKKRSKAPKQHQAEEKLISSGMSSKILKEALAQQREIQDEAEERSPDDNNSLVLAQGFTEAEEAQDDIDEFAGFSETQSQFGAYDVSGIVLF